MPTDTIKVYINTGPLSFENGATNPGPLLTYMRLADQLVLKPDLGTNYGTDSLRIPLADWPAAKDILTQACMIFRLEGEPHWENVREDKVRSYLMGADEPLRTPAPDVAEITAAVIAAAAASSKTATRPGLVTHQRPGDHRLGQHQGCIPPVPTAPPRCSS